MVFLQLLYFVAVTDKKMQNEQTEPEGVQRYVYWLSLFVNKTTKKGSNKPKLV